MLIRQKSEEWVSQFYLSQTRCSMCKWTHFTLPSMFSANGRSTGSVGYSWVHESRYGIRCMAAEGKPEHCAWNILGTLCALSSLDCAVIFLCSTREGMFPRKGLFCIAHMRKAHTVWLFQEPLGFYTLYIKYISIFSNWTLMNTFPFFFHL